LARQPKAFLACYLVLIRDGRIMLSRRANTGYQDGKYSMIAGHVEDRESVWEALIREAREEAGMSLSSNMLKMLHIGHRQDIDREYIDFYIAADTKEEPRNLEPQKCDELKWFGLDSLPDGMVPYVRDAVENIKKGELYSEYVVR
jgi:8-oxo-dGTP diphosphatase